MFESINCCSSWLYVSVYLLMFDILHYINIKSEIAETGQLFMIIFVHIWSFFVLLWLFLKLLCLFLDSPALFIIII